MKNRIFKFKINKKRVCFVPKLFDTNSQREHGFTLVELLVIVAVMLILTGLVFTIFGGNGGTFSLQRSATKMTQNLRIMEEQAMSAKEYEGTIPPNGCSNCYGVYFNTISSPNSYILFADTNGSNSYNVGDGIIETILLEDTIYLENVSFGPVLTIIFNPPDPTVIIDGNPNNLSAVITLKSELTEMTEEIFINKAGLINIQ